jgi:hypothetical protein
MSNTIDDGLKASLATLELVKYSYASRVGEKALSNDEVESAHRYLLQIVQAAESIKQKLPSSIIKVEIDDIALGSTNVINATEDSGSIAEPSSSSVHADEKKSVDGDDKEEHQEPKNILFVSSEIRDKCGNDTGHSNVNRGRINDDSGENDSKSGIPQRRLSTPFLMPMDATGANATGIEVSPNFRKSSSTLQDSYV